MTRDDLIFAFNHTQSDYLLAAAKSMQTKTLPVHRPRLRYALIAACLALLIAMIPIVIMLSNRAILPPNPPTTTTPSNPPQSPTHLSITDIPGAISVDTALLDCQIDLSMSKFKYKEFPEETRQNRFGFLGTVISGESVMIKYPSEINENRYIHLTVLEIRKDENVCNADNLNTVKVVYQSIYYLNPNETYRLSIINSTLDLGICGQKEPYAFYVIDEVEEFTTKYNIKSPINLSDYADYYLVMHASYKIEYGIPYVSHDRLFQMPLSEFQ